VKLTIRPTKVSLFDPIVKYSRHRQLIDNKSTTENISCLLPNFEAIHLHQPSPRLSHRSKLLIRRPWENSSHQQSGPCPIVVSLELYFRGGRGAPHSLSPSSRPLSSTSPSEAVAPANLAKLNVMKWFKKKKSKSFDQEPFRNLPQQYGTPPASGIELIAKLPASLLERIFSFVCPHTHDETYESCEQSAVEDTCMLCDLRDLAHCAQVSRRWRKLGANVL
jgi:hypothetical protein